MIAMVPKPEAPSEADNIIASMASLQASPGWAIVVKIINENIAYLEKAILEKIDPATGIKLSDQEVEVLRIKRSLNIDVRDTPQNYAQVIRETNETPHDYDPYFKTNDDIIKARNLANSEQGI